MGNAPGTIIFDDFPMGRWRVAWIGDVDFHSRLQMGSQPTVKVVLQEVRKDNRPHIVERTVTISQLYALPLGRIWENKTRTEEHDSAQQERIVELRTAMVTEGPVGRTMRDKTSQEFLLPFSSYIYHREHTKSWCLNVDVNEETIIFPAMELIRFYFGSSVGLIKKIFSADFAPSRIATRQEMKRGNAAHVNLASGIAAASAADVARICFDKAAQQAASMVSRSLVAAKASGLESKLYAKTAFPFSGKSKMLVSGLQLKRNDGQNRFLVTEIRSCSAPFPFLRLNYVAMSKSHGKPSTENKGGTNNASTATVKRTASAQTSHQVVKNIEPKKSATAQSVVWGSESRFPDLQNKPIFKVDPEIPAQAQLSMMPAQAFASTGDGVASGNGKRIDPDLQPDERWRLEKLYCPDTRWAAYFEFLKMLATQDWVSSMSFVRVDPRQAHPHFAQLPELIDADGAIIESTLRVKRCTAGGTHLEHRLASLVNLQAMGNVACMVSLCPLAEDEFIRASIWIGHTFEPNSALVAVAAADTGNAGSLEILFTTNHEMAAEHLEGEREIAIHSLHSGLLKISH
jgi:hypothetical protein